MFRGRDGAARAEGAGAAPGWEVPVGSRAPRAAARARPPGRPARRPARGARAAGARLASREPEGAASPLEVAGGTREGAFCSTTTGRLVRWGGVRAASVLTHFLPLGWGEKKKIFVLRLVFIGRSLPPHPHYWAVPPETNDPLELPSGPRTRRCRGCFRFPAIVRSGRRFSAFFRAQVPAAFSGRRSRGTRTPSAQVPRVPASAASFRGVASSENNLLVMLAVPVFTVKRTGDGAGAYRVRLNWPGCRP